MVTKDSLLRAVFVLFNAAGLALYTAAFCIPYWVQHGRTIDGLFMICVDNPRGATACAMHPQHNLSHLFRLVQALGCIALIFYTFFVLFSGMSIFWSKNWRKLKCIKYFTFLLALATVIFVSGCAAVIAVQNLTDLQILYGWYLAIASDLIAAIAAPFYLIEALQAKKLKWDDSRKPLLKGHPSSLLTDYSALEDYSALTDYSAETDYSALTDYTEPTDYTGLTDYSGSIDYSAATDYSAPTDYSETVDYSETIGYSDSQIADYPTPLRPDYYTWMTTDYINDDDIRGDEKLKKTQSRRRSSLYSDGDDKKHHHVQFVPTLRLDTSGSNRQYYNPCSAKRTYLGDLF